MKYFLKTLKFIRSQYKIELYLLLIILLSFYLRTYKINWDDGYYFHPDERAIVMFATPLMIPESLHELLSPQSPLNPHFFAYGNFPLYLVRILGEITSPINPEFTEYSGMFVVGRLISAIADTLTVFIIFLIGIKIKSRSVGLFAALSYAVSVFPIQAAHFFAVDSLLTFLTTSTVLFLINYSQKQSIKNVFFVGLFMGLSLATKVSSAIFLLPILIIISYNLYSSSHKRIICVHFLILICTVLVFFAGTQPYVLIDQKAFWDQVNQQSQMSKNAFIFPYTLQYVGKIPYFYEIKNIAIWGQGLLIFLFSIFGFLLLLAKTIKAKKAFSAAAIVIFTGILYFAVFGKFAVGWMRYMLPLYPILSVCSGYFLVWAITKIPNHFLKNYLMKKTILIIFCTIMLLYPISFLSIYYKPNTRLQATEWIHKNIPRNTIVAVEHWDDALPVTDGANYIQLSLPLYEPDTTDKWKAIDQSLQTAQYIFIASNRLYSPLRKLTNCESLPSGKCYTRTARYYSDLFGGKLGFSKVAEFSEYPTVPFINIELNDDSADESFTVYDHPKIMIFKKD